MEKFSPFHSIIRIRLLYVNCLVEIFWFLFRSSVAVTFHCALLIEGNKQAGFTLLSRITSIGWKITFLAGVSSPFILCTMKSTMHLQIFCCCRSTEESCGNMSWSKSRLSMPMMEISSRIRILFFRNIECLFFMQYAMLTIGNMTWYDIYASKFRTDSFRNHICPIHDESHESLDAGYTRGLPMGGSQVSWYFTREFKIDVKKL